MDSHTHDQVVVIMVPFPAQSHLNQLLQLSCLISYNNNNIQLHYACSATHIHQVKLRFSHKNHLEAAKIHFHQLPTPPFLSPPPNPNNPSTKFPTHFLPSFEASLNLRQPITSLIREISPKARRIIVIHDVLMSYVVQDISTVPNAESYAFSPCSAFTSFFDGWEIMGKPDLLQIQVPEGLPSIEGCYPLEILKFIALQGEFLNITSGFIYNSCRSVEGRYIDLRGNDQINGETQKWVIGPLNLTVLQESTRKSNNRHKCLDWLDKQAPNSVLYVCFGSTTSLSDEQIKELAIGLEQSRQKFIWVLREADKGDIFEGDFERDQVLPEGYEERVREVGIVVRDWAPQLEILGHKSTGGFMSHCGWNSVTESLSMGVPIAAWPMHSDQPKNAFLVTEILKIGVPVFEWDQHRKEIVSSSRVEEVVRRLMGSEEGEEMRKRADKLGGAVQKSVKEGGVSSLELDSFIAHITRYR